MTTFLLSKIQTATLGLNFWCGSAYFTGIRSKMLPVIDFNGRMDNSYGIS